MIAGRQLRWLSIGAWGRRILVNAAWTAVAEGAVRLLKIVLTLVIVRLLGPTDYGRFTFAFSVVTLFGVLFDGGVLITATREFSLDAKNEEELSDLAMLKVALGIVGMAVIAGAMLLMTNDPAVRVTILAMGTYQVVQEVTNIAFAVFRGRGQMRYEAYVRTFQAVVLLPAVLVGVWLASRVEMVAAAHVFSGVASLALAAVLLGRQGVRLRARVRLAVWHRWVQLAAPLAGVTTLSVLANNLDSALLGLWRGVTDTGLYGAAIRVQGAALIPMSLLALVTLPAFAGAATIAPEVLRRRWTRWQEGMVALGTVSAAVLLVQADGIVALLYGDAFAPAAAALRVMSISTFFLCAFTPAFQALVVYRRQGALMLVLAIDALLNAGANAVLIPLAGPVGAAWAGALTQGALWVMLLVLCRQFGLPAWAGGAYVPVYGMAAVAGLAAYVAMRVIAGPVWLVVPAGAAIFAASYFLVRGTARWVTSRHREAVARV